MKVGVSCKCFEEAELELMEDEEIMNHLTYFMMYYDYIEKRVVLTQDSSIYSLQI